MKAVVIEDGKAVVKEGVPIPELEEGFVLIKTLAVLVTRLIGHTLTTRSGLKDLFWDVMLLAKLSNWAQLSILKTFLSVIIFMGSFTDLP